MSTIMSEGIHASFRHFFCWPNHMAKRGLWNFRWEETCFEAENVGHGKSNLYTRMNSEFFSSRPVKGAFNDTKYEVQVPLCYDCAEPEGPLAPKTPGRWRAVWASDNVRLEEAHRAGVDEVLVCGRKYMVDMKGRRIRALYWREEPEWRPVIRATYFLRQGNGWLPYTEEDAQAVEDYQSCSRGGVRDGTCVEAGIALADGRNKVLVRRKMLPEGATQGPEAEERKSRGSTELELEYIQKPLKAQNILQSFGLNTREVHRGAPEPGSWGGVSCSEEDHPQEASLPEHLVFVVHGIGESMWSKASTSVVSFRSSCQDMRNLSLQLREAQRLQREDSKRADTAAGEETSPRGMEEDVRHVEFLPVEWYELLHGEDKEAERIMQDITLPSISAFREFAGQAIMDVMYYLTPDIQKAILTTVVSEMNRMWAVFKETNPTFTGKVSIMGHSLGSIITHDVLSAQPLGKIQTGSFAHELQVPILQFEPEVFLACGSPIGMFLVLRSGSLDRQKLLKFETTKRFYNVFHPADPVAYRLEPVLDHRLRNLEPERVPHIGGDRMHIKVQKINRTVTRAVSRFAKTADENLQMLSKSWVNTLKAVKGELPLLENSRAATGDAIAEAEALLPERIDWALQETAFEGTQPWAAAIFAHGCYFQNIDVMMFLVNAMETPEP